MNKKIFTKKLFMYMVAAFTVIIAVIFTLQTFTNRRSNMDPSIAKQTNMLS